MQLRPQIPHAYFCNLLKISNDMNFKASFLHKQGSLGKCHYSSRTNETCYAKIVCDTKIKIKNETIVWAAMNCSLKSLWKFHFIIIKLIKIRHATISITKCIFPQFPMSTYHGKR